MRLLTANEVANILRVSTARVYELARIKSIPSITLGQRQVRFDETALRDWISRSSSARFATQEAQTNVQ
jgi:excisionase family DNA binding protein